LLRKHVWLSEEAGTKTNVENDGTETEKREAGKFERVCDRAESFEIDNAFVGSCELIDNVQSEAAASTTECRKKVAECV
jgi:hypothetical protein